MLKILVFPFLFVGVALLLVAIYLPRNRSLKKIAQSEAEKSEQVSSNVFFMVVCFGIVIAGACWYFFDGLLGELIALLVLAVTFLSIVLILVIDLASRIFVRGVPIAMEAGRQMTPEQRQKAADFVWQNGKKVIEKAFSSSDAKS